MMAADPLPAAVQPVTARVRPAESRVRTGERFVVSVDVDLGPGGQRLGAYGASLYWAPGVLRYLGYTGGTGAFNTPVVNAQEAGLGVLRFADADPAGAAGLVTLVNVTFEVIATPCATSFLSLQFDTMSTASTFENLLAALTVIDGSALILDVPLAISVSGSIDTTLDWTAVQGAITYDVIRGDVGGLRDNGTAVSLGVVTCIENDSLDTTTGSGTEAANPDSGIPPPGRAFFYLVRFDDGTGDSTYGFPARCARERIPDSGDCP
jgi:hypothetical protein